MTQQQQPRRLDQDYINEHLSQLHTPETWGATILDAALKQASQNVAGLTEPPASVEVDVPITVSPVEYQGRLCVQLCAFGFCVHVG
ncbi:hypothetical protein MCCC1A01412_20900 [Bacillus anthracis]|uniref:hypothetical protein n=1 Tax=Bacillus anthracis TaxID=1392 RepID=UPI0008FDC653|nr:hypothetical protein [Bacillus anthracis]AXO96268.1 hypothetical protein DY471_28380 [Bacillus anthracis]OJD86680.1 hypothetical protein MCCC1A01412_20900 [Bacillus anthracis]